MKTAVEVPAGEKILRAENTPCDAGEGEAEVCLRYSYSSARCRYLFPR